MNDSKQRKKLKFPLVIMGLYNKAYKAKAEEYEADFRAWLTGDETADWLKAFCFAVTQFLMWISILLEFIERPELERSKIQKLVGKGGEVN